MEIGILIPLILTILILLFIGFRQHSTFREKKKFHETQMQQMARSFAAERKSFIQEEKILKKRLLKKEDEVISLRNRDFSLQQPTYNEPPPELFHKNAYWVALSAWYRREQDWMCEACGINLKTASHFLHVHHVHGRGYNAPEYLVALCVLCHSEQPDHAFMKTSQEYRDFMKWKKTKKGGS